MIVTKKDLIKLARKKGFDESFLTMNWEFWLCSLHKWLREIHDLDVTATPYLNEEYDEKQYMVYNTVEITTFKEFYSYEKALEYGLFKALNLL